MVNLYAYTYPNYENVKPGYILTKCGDSIRDVDIRMNEQGGAAEAFAKVIVGSWPGLQKIQRDYEVHDVLKKVQAHLADSVIILAKSKSRNPISRRYG